MQMNSDLLSLRRQSSRVRVKALTSLRVAVTAVFTVSATIGPVLAQTPNVNGQPPAPAGVPAPEKPVFTMTDLEYMLCPIALYPDPLLALVLPASTFPLQIVQADRWLAANPGAVEKNDFTAVDAMKWDASVRALTRFPSVIELLADHLEWTESLGEAFALQGEDVAAAVQLLRARAESIGNLKTTPEQTVVVRDEGGARVIYIAPAVPERIYVPVYDSSVVFTSALPIALAFTTGVFVGSAWNNQWGWNNRRWNDVWIDNRTVVNVNRGPRPDRPGAWRPDRPGQRPQRPDVNRPRPDRPVARPDRPRPDRPAARPDRPTARPDRPAVRPEGSTARPDRPAVRPDRPTARPDRPASRPDRPAARPDRPADRPDRPAARPNRSADRPSAQRPQSRPQQSRPQARPQQRPQARPQQRPQQRPQARPQQRAQQGNARPNRQNARPQQQRGQRQGSGDRRNRSSN